MDNNFREKAKQVLRKQIERFDSGGAFYDWTDEGREIWQQISALSPADRRALDDEVRTSQFEDFLRASKQGLESLRELGIDIPDVQTPVETKNRFECESCGRKIIVPSFWRSKDEVLQALERERVNHRRECTGPPRKRT